ncbi:MAG: hypothetical protein KJ710_05420, partial [Candidatus Omnitrophica bacterium]|nr:hypothetical protein [Candidatus Omnitrophota bacterium]
MKHRGPAPVGMNAKTDSTTKDKVITTEDLGYIFSKIKKAEEFTKHLSEDFKPLYDSVQKINKELDAITKRITKISQEGEFDLIEGELKSLYDSKDTLENELKNRKGEFERKVSNIIGAFKTKILLGSKILKGRGVVEKDKPIWAFFINLWQPITLLVSAVGLNILALAIEIPGSIGLLIMAAGFVVAMALLTGITNKINTNNDKTEPLTDGNPRKTALVFWSYFSLMLGSGFSINYFMLQWSKEVLVSLTEFGPWAVGTWGFMIPVALLTGLIIVLTFMSAAYGFEALFAYLQGKCEGVGQIKTLVQAKHRFGEAREMFIKLSETARTNQDKKIEIFKRVWETMLSTLRTSGDIDGEAEKWLKSWLNNTRTNRQGFISEEAEERIMRAVEGWLMDLTPALWWNYVLPVSFMTIGSSESLWWGVDDVASKVNPKITADDLFSIDMFDRRFGKKETRLNFIKRLFFDKPWIGFVNDLKIDDLTDKKISDLSIDDRVELAKRLKLIKQDLLGTLGDQKQSKLVTDNPILLNKIVGWINKDDVREERTYVYKINVLKVEENAEETRLNFMIRKNYEQWYNFVISLKISDALKKELLSLKDHQIPGEEILNDHNLVYEIEKWVNERSWSACRTIADFEKIRLAWELFAELFFPDASQEEIKDLVDRKLQLVFHYPDYYNK